jgi:hypothetical protein
LSLALLGADATQKITAHQRFGCVERGLFSGPRRVGVVGVDVVLNQVSQPGTSSKRRRLARLDVVPDGDDQFARLCERSTLPMLGRVDPYSDLVLTTVEMAQFLAELDTELGDARGAGEQELLQAIRALAERCATGTDLELHFEGD